jgi:hypothetical protein
MRNLILSALLLASAFQTAFAQGLLQQTFGSGANAFTIDFVTIGNPGNTADNGIWAYSRGSYSAGAVNYIYNIGKYEISREQIAKANSEAGLGISLWDMTINPVYGGFGHSWEANGGGRPASGVSWYGAARFVNYLNASKGYQAAYKFNGSAFETWNPGDLGFQAVNPYRNANAFYFLPSLDEWYKAAFGSPNGTWFDYATGSNIAPTGVAQGTDSGTAVMGQSYYKGAANITEAGGLSAFGTMAQNGNMREFTESASDGVNDNTPGERRMARGGSWHSPSWAGASDYDDGVNPGTSDGEYGFRIASVPEPSSLSLLLIGVAGLASRRLLKRKD